MDTHTDEVFTLRYYKYENKAMNEYPVDNFYTDMDILLKEGKPSIEIEEFTNIDLYFNSDDVTARLYMDGLETLPESSIEVDVNGVAYRKPKNERFVLFQYNGDYYPMIPGKYQGMVVTDKCTYYFFIEVKPKRITEDELDILRKDLESILRGLAQDLIRKNIGIGYNFSQILPSRQLYKFLVIKNHFNDVMVSLTDLYTKVNYKVKKQYKRVLAEKAVNIDEKTMQYMTGRLDNDNWLMAPYKSYDYNLAENRWLKYIVDYVKKELKSFENALISYIKVLDNEISKDEFYAKFEENVKAVVREKKRARSELGKYISLCKKMWDAFSLIESRFWYQEIEPKKMESIPYVMIVDPRYKNLYNLYKDLKQEDLKIMLDSTYAYNWKRTDKLFEMWGFFTLYRILTGSTLQYVNKRAEFFAQEYESNQYIIPELKAGSGFMLENDDIRIHLVYDRKVPLTDADTDAENNPIYMIGSTRTRPDTRMDIYFKGIYIGSIIMDFKYRHIRSIWDKAKIRSADRPDSMRQLTAYKTQATSSHIFGKYVSRHIKKRISPIIEVWAIYPKDNYASEIEHSPDHSITLVKMTPGNEYAHIEQRLSSIIAELVEQAQELSEGKL